MNIDHININGPMELLEQVRDFYCSVFGLVDGDRPTFRKRGFWLYSDDRPLIHLFESDHHYASERQGYLDHVAFSVTGLEAFVERLEKENIPFRVSHISERDMTQLFFKDPAGTGLEANFVGEKLL